MALIARQGRVTARQRKLRKFVVIEGVGFPVARVMAGVTAVTVIAFVRIVLLMTTDARRCDIAVLIGLRVARVASRRSMLVEQRKARFRVVVVRYAPIFRGVAALTVFPKCRLVTVIFFVTGETVFRCVLEIR